MCSAPHKIRAPIPFRRLLRIRRKDVAVQEQEIPDQHRQADIHWKRQLSLGGARVDRLHGMHEVDVERMRIIVSELGVRGIGHRRIEVRPVAANSAMKRLGKFFFRVSSDPEICRRGYICGINSAERRANGEPTCKGLAAWEGVAGSAIRGNCQIFPARDHTHIGGRIGLFGRI